MQLRYYQRDAIDSLYKYLETNDGNALIVLPTGTGKSLVIAQVIEELTTQWPSTRILIATHSRELVSQNYSEFINLSPFAPAGIFSAGLNRRDSDAQILFCGIQSIYRRAYDIQRCDILLIDECFVGETLVQTPMGEKRIDLVRCGDTVYNASGFGVVKKVFSHSVDETLLMEFSDGTSIECTRGHPFFTERGWVTAGDMEKGEGVYSREAVRLLWENNASVDKENRVRTGKKRTTRKMLFSSKMLLSVLCQEVDQPHEQSPIKTKDEGKVAGDKAQTYKAWRQRAIAAFSTIGPTSCARGGMGIGSAGAYKETEGDRISDLLQNRHCEQGENDRNRTRWREPLHFGKARAGRKKNGTTVQPRLVNISVIKHESPRTVFNLHISGHPSYFANGKLVHNCHTISQKGSGMWHQFITEITKINPDIRIVGLTATDYRLDSGLLTTGENKIFDDVCYEYGLLDAIKDGYLCPIIPASMATRFDLSGVGTRMGEWKQDELESAINIDSITRKAIDEIEAYGQDRKSWLIFACGNKHAEAIHLELKRRGYDGACVTEKTHKADRDAAVNGIRNYKIRYLVNNVIFTTGFNAPNIDLIADLAPTKSPGRHVQKAGRGTRCIGANVEESIANGKSNCILLDFARNVDYHGPLDKIRGKDKTKGEGGDAPMKVCPECHQVCFAGLRKCFVCGYEFEGMGGPDIRSHGGDSAVLSTQIEPTWYTVNEMYLNRHAREGKIPSMRVDYYDFAQGKVSEWVCFEHTGFARQKAEKWHRVRLYDSPVPNNVDDAIALPYPKPSKILVRWEGKYARVIDYDFRVDEKEEEIKPVSKIEHTIRYQDGEEDYIIPF